MPHRGIEALCYMRGLGLDDEAGRAKIAAALDQFALQFGAARLAPVRSQGDAVSVIAALLDFVGRQHLVSMSPAYRQGGWLDHVAAAIAQHLESSCRGASTWSEALDIYEGEYAIPLMTIHKSKGLEYHTVIFVGLDDGAWFSFHSQTKEEMCSFFVAFTRAKQRVILTYCASRGTRNSIAPLYGLLKRAGVNAVAH